MPINKILQPLDVNITPRKESTKSSHGRTASVPSTPPLPLPLSPSCRQTWENATPTWTNEASLAGVEWRNAQSKRQASNCSTLSSTSSYEPDVPSNPKYWMPQHVAAYVTSCLVNVNKVPSSSPTRPNYFVQDLARYIKNEARWTGSQFLRLHEQDLVDRGMSEVWRKIVMDTVRQCRRERLRGRVLGSDPGSFYEDVQEDDDNDNMSVLTNTTYQTSCETLSSENGDERELHQRDYFGLGIQGTLQQRSDREPHARKEDIDALGLDIESTNRKVTRLQEQIETTSHDVKEIKEAVATMTASKGSYAKQEDLESLRRELLSELSKLEMPPLPKPETSAAPSSSSRRTHHRYSSEAAAVYARRVSTTVASTASKAADLAVSNSLFTFSSIALFAIVALSFTQHESRATSVNHFLQARR